MDVTLRDPQNTGDWSTSALFSRGVNPLKKIHKNSFTDHGCSAPSPRVDNSGRRPYVGRPTIPGVTAHNEDFAANSSTSVGNDTLDAARIPTAREDLPILPPDPKSRRKTMKKWFAES